MTTTRRRSGEPLANARPPQDVDVARDEMIDSADEDDFSAAQEAWEASEAEQVDRIAADMRVLVRQLLALLGPSQTKAALRYVSGWVRQERRGGRKPDTDLNEKILQSYDGRPRGLTQEDWTEAHAGRFGMDPENLGRRLRRQLAVRESYKDAVRRFRQASNIS